VIRRYYFPTGAKRIRVTPDGPDAFRAAMEAAGIPISTGGQGGAGQRR
jgi:hypothetical protein